MAVLGTSAEILLADATSMLDEIFLMEDIAQEARFGDTVQHITRSSSWAGGALHKKMANQIFSRTLSNSDLESDAPLAGKIDTLDVQIEESHLRKLHFSLRHTIPAHQEVDGSKDAVYDLAMELALQALQSIDEKRNHMIHQNSDGVKAVVVQKYDPDGTAYSGYSSDANGTYRGSAGVAMAFLQVDQGSISKFHQGELIDIRIASTEVNRVVGVVCDVWHDTVYQGLSVGPGLLVAADAAGDSAAHFDLGGDTDFDNAVDGDEIFSSGEADGSGLPVGFGELFKRSGTLAYFGITDRTAPGYQFLIPYGRDYSSGGASVEIDIDTHFGNMADTMGMLFGPARLNRRKRGFAMTEAIVCICPPDLVNTVARQAGQSTIQFTAEAASNLPEARRKQLTSVQGWVGSVIQHPTLPPIVLQGDPCATKDTIRIFEPSTFEFIRMGSKIPKFIPNASGGKWHNRRNVTTGQLTMSMDASGFVVETLFCDQPQLNYSIEGVKKDI